MDNELRQLLTLVQEGKLPAAEAKRRLSELRGRVSLVGAAPMHEGAQSAAPLGESAGTEAAPRNGRPIAVIGMAGRFAGARSLREFFTNLTAGVCSIREVPKSRWDAARYYDPSPDATGKTNCRWGGFLDGIEEFDPLFFNMSGREADLTDPQQRLFLEVAWQALEDAGYASQAISGVRCGVFAGAPSSDYEGVLRDAGVEPDAQVLMGNDSAILAARISYALNLKGPSIALNTACSSSLVAVALGCQAIESGQCEMALAGGVCLFVTPGFYIAAAKAGMLSPDGRCMAFDQHANGFVPGEGVGVVSLKELNAALRDGDHIYGVILGTSTNQDGKTNGITAPSSLSQTAVQLEAYRKAGISPASITLVEAHGTGTALGDPIEIEALQRSFAQYTDRKGYCAIGSVKTNIGHTGQAAGIAGLMKVLLALQHETIPQSLHVQKVNERIHLEETPFKIATTKMPWPRVAGAPRRAAVSSFGYSGTNAHLVIEEAPCPLEEPAASRPDWQLVLLSAKTDEALAQKIADLRLFLEEAKAPPAVEQVAYTLHAGRKHFSIRRAVVARSLEELRDALSAAGAGRPGMEGGALSALEKRQWAERLQREINPLDLTGERRRETLQQLAELYIRGLDLEVSLLFEAGKGRRVSLPSYPFSRERHWVDQSGTAQRPDAVVRKTAQLPTLKDRLEKLGQQRYCLRLEPQDFFAIEHVMQGQAIFPAAVALELARAAGECWPLPAWSQLRDVVWLRPLPCQPGEQLEVRLQADGATVRFEIGLRGQMPEACCVAGRLSAEEGRPTAQLDLAALRKNCTHWLSKESCYELFQRFGLQYGPSFQCIQELGCTPLTVLARVALPPSLRLTLPQYALHPVLLDGALQSLLGLHKEDAEAGVCYAPYRLERLKVSGPLPEVCYVVAKKRTAEAFDILISDESGNVVAELWALTIAKFASSQLCRYRPVWQKTEASVCDGAQARYLVLHDDADLASRLLERRDRGGFLFARLGPRFRRLSNLEYELEPTSKADYIALFQSLPAAELPTRVLLIWEASGGAEHRPPIPDLSRSLYALLALCQALRQVRLGGSVSLALLYPIYHERAPAHLAALGAFSRTLRAEAPDLRLQLIGLPADEKGLLPVEAYWPEVMAELENPINYEVRYDRAKTRYTKRLEELTEKAPAALKVRPHGAYLITGGAGGIGLLIAGRLVRRGANVVLVGRSELTEAKQEAIEKLRTSEASAFYDRADISQQASVEEVVRRTLQRFGAIHGIIHAAGVIRDSFILHKTTAQVREVIAPKVNGTIWLDLATQALPLDFFVVFSSATAYLGNLGQADYAFANAFLDEFALLRQSLVEEGKRSGRTISIAWPAWRHGGMHSERDGQARPELAGSVPLDSEEGLDAFEQAVALGATQLMLLKGSPSAIKSAVALAAQPQPTATEQEPPADAPSSAAEQQVVAEYLRNVLAHELRVPRARLRSSEPFDSFGIDSVMVMRLSSRLEADLGELPKTLFFEYQNIEDLSGYLLSHRRSRLNQLLNREAQDSQTQERVKSQARPSGGASIEPGAQLPSSNVQPQGTVGPEEPMAIIGLVGRYPMATNLEEFWQNLLAGRDCVSEIPRDRWALEEFYDPMRGRPGKSYSKWGGFLTDIDKFDARFFNILPREADLLDPQERLFLEACWHLLEDAGYSRSALRDRRVGVFVGVMYGQYQLLTASAADGYLGISSYASIANRVSYFCNFHGPSLAVDTMCSSSLTALHLACESIRRGECELAIVGGVNLSIHPHKYLQIALGEFASSDGKCRSFGAGGDGYVPGEGVGAVLLKPLAAARTDGDNIRALIRGSAVNHGGRTSGYTVPNPQAQSEVIAEALRRSHLDARSISYIEAHGTGTALGDPIEIAALTKVFSGDRQEHGWCPIGSVKSNIGHLEAAAGVAALTKAVLQMQHGILAPSLHAEKLNPNIDFANSPFFVQKELAEWRRASLPRNGASAAVQPRRAGVSSFGAGGTNAHVVLEEYELPALHRVEEDQILVLSARSKEALRILAQRLADRLEGALGTWPRAWQARLRGDLLLKASTLLGVGASELGSEDDLGECGLDEVGMARLIDAIRDVTGLRGDAVASQAPRTVEQLASLLVAEHGAELAKYYGARGHDVPAVPEAETLRLVDVAYTLQIGREVMEERLALIARGLSDAARILRSFVAGQLEGEVYAGRALDGEGDSILEIFEGQAGAAYLSSLIEEKAWSRLAQLWVRGARVHFHLLNQGGIRRRVALPGYPFARDRHWLPSKVRTLPMAEEPRRGEASGQPLADVISKRPQAVKKAPEEAELEGITQLTALVAELIGTSPDKVDAQVNLGDYGFESLTYKELATKISARFGVAALPTLFFEHPSIAKLASWLTQKQGAVLAPWQQDKVGGSATAPPDTDTASMAESTSVMGAGAVGGEPIAIIGMSGRFPGSKDLHAYWQNLRAECDLIAEIPSERWDWRDFDHEGMAPEERCRARVGGFIEDADKFDPLFFGISPAEAEMMDPQQRILLETAWAAIEDAGYRPSQLAGMGVGIFAGIQFSDYQHLLHEAGILTAQSGVGNEHSIAVNRISYLLNFRGPSEPVNTACSSSLVAVHRAVCSLRRGESSIALAGGIALNLAPYSTIAAEKMGLLSPEGRCKTLDRSANGYVKGEGVGILLLKPLRQAVADGDHIYAVIRGTATNHGGRAASLTAPNAQAQAELIVDAMKDGAVDPRTVGYLELHGTGTELGDPIEINGIKTAFRQLLTEEAGGAGAERPWCGLGSVKTNIGHLEPASGIAGMMKVILAMQHKELPGLLHLKELNPYVEFLGSPFFIVEKTQPWARLRAESPVSPPLVAGVSSFGFGGVNAHVVLEEYVSAAEALPPTPAGEQVFVFSAKTEEALRTLAAAFLQYLERCKQDGKLPASECVAYTLQLGREEFKERLACVAHDILELANRLDRHLKGETLVERLYVGHAERRPPAKAAADDLDAVAKEWVFGGAVDWQALHRGRKPRRVSLPSYPFTKRRYWFAAPGGKESAGALRRTVAPADPSLQVDSERASVAAPAGGAASPSGEALVLGALRDILAVKLKLPPDELREDTNLQEFGVDSMFGAMIVQAVQEKFSCQIPLKAPTDYPTLRTLAQYIYQECLGGQMSASIAVGQLSVPPAAPSAHADVPTGSGQASKKLPPELLPINRNGSRQPSFWVHGATGYSIWFQNLSDALGPEYPLYAFQARGTNGVTMPQTLEEMIEHYVHCIRLVQPHGPYFLGGYSFGGLIAMEMARRLQSEGETIRHLVMFDTYPATQEVFNRHFGPYDEDFLPLYLVNYFLNAKDNPHLLIHKSDIANLPKRLQLATLAKLAKERGKKRMSTDDIFLYLRGGLLCSEFSEGIYQCYKPQPYDASDILFFRATDGFTGQATAAYWPPTNILEGYDYTQPWRDLAKRGFQVAELDNDHLNMLEEPTLTVATQHIEALLRAPLPFEHQEFARFQEGFQRVTTFGSRLLTKKLLSIGALAVPPALETTSGLRQKLHVMPQYERLFRATVDILEREGYVKNNQEEIVGTSKLSELAQDGSIEDMQAESDTLGRAHPEVKGYLALLLAALDGFLDVICGRRDPLDVLFPNGSMALVGSLYQGNLQSDYYNQLVGTAVAEHVRHHVRRYKYGQIQVFEVGAGTGSTSVSVLNDLHPYADRLRYYFTDLGSSFVQMSKFEFGAKYPFLSFAVFDIEKATELQGFEPGTMDVVIASNVLHATRNLKNSIMECCRLLKPGGVLILNEFTERHDYNTMTFGLTPGWWLYEDEELRISGSPAVTACGWRQLLETHGFHEVQIRGLPDMDIDELPQCAIIAKRRPA